MTHRMEQFTEIKPCVVEGEPDAHNVFLKVGSQSFCVTSFACETKADAEWTRDQLCTALENIVVAIAQGG